jgi:hypothetical protein
MKYSKNIFLLVFTFFAVQLFSQNAYSDNAFIQNSIKNLSTIISRGGSNEVFSEAQKLKLEKIFAQKETKWNAIISSKKDKGDMAEDIKALDKEFAPRIEDLLSKEQKIAFRKISSAKI